MSAPPAPPLLLASTSPQRRNILEQLGVPFDIVAPDYEEHDQPGVDAVELVKAHALGKARSVADQADGRPVLGVDTAVVLGGRVYGKPANAEAAAEMSRGVSSRKVTLVDHVATSVTFRELTPRDIAVYVASDEWQGRAGAYAIQGLGAALVQSIEGDYLNVVGLPAALLVSVLAERFAGVYGFG